MNTPSGMESIRTIVGTADADSQGRSAVRSRDLWVTCPACRELLYARQHSDHLKVCMRCGYHFRLSPGERLASFLDAGSFEERDALLCSTDPLDFVAGDVSYRAKLEKHADGVISREALIYGTGGIDGQRIVVAVHDFQFLAGSMGVVVGEKVARAMELASDSDLPLVIVVASGGARQQEGAYALLQMAKSVAALDRLKAHCLPYISILTDPTLGGVAASYGMLGDVIIAEPGATIGFAGPRVIEQATRSRVQEGINTAELMLARGMIDLVIPRSGLRTTIANLLRIYATRPYRPALRGYRRQIPNAGTSALRADARFC